MSQEKLVSIALPTYNRAKYIRRAIDAILAQDYTNFELIIADNASVDETPEICKEYCARDERIRYIRLEKNIGMLPDWVVAFKEAKGVYFMWIADDDWWAPEYVSTLVAALENNPTHGVALCSFRRVYADGGVHDEMIMTGENDVTHDSYVSVHAKVFKNTLLNQFVFGLFRRSLLLEIFKNPVPHVNGWDKFLISEIVFATRFYCAEPLLRFVSQRRKNTPKISYHPVRYPGDPHRPMYFLPTAYTLMLWRSFWRVVHSHAIPFWRKPLVVPALLSVLWFQRRRYIGFSFRDVERFWHQKVLRGDPY